MKPFILLLMGVLTGGLAFAAVTPPLERQVNLTVNNEKITTVLEKIHDQTGLVFSYQASIFNEAQPVSIQLKNKTVREALALVLPKNIAFKPRNKYIILKEKPVEKDPKKTEISGYVYDKNTDQKLSNVTLYDKTTLQSVTTDRYGFYSITVPKDNQCLSVNKETYRDTCIAVLPDNPITNISIETDSLAVKDTIAWRKRMSDFGQKTSELFRRFKGYVNTKNVRDTFTREFQVSLLPFTGSNGLLSGSVYNRFSLNILGGYSRGTRVLELGGLFNVDRSTVHGLQAAGWFNLVGDSVEGAQLAGLFNITGRHVDGLQTAGIFNFNLGKMDGMQAAGIFNLNIKKVTGAQAAGIANLNYNGVNGFSAAGIVNMSRFSVSGSQLAGIVNICADTMQGSSVAGITNLNWYSKQSVEIAAILNSARYGDRNAQISGLVNNTAKGSTRLQIGLVNRAHQLRGLQLGFVNLCDSARGGVPIGFLSFVRSGLHQVELSSDELFYANISVRSGVNAFYNVFNFGRQPGQNNLWSFGYGAGTSFRLRDKFRADLVITASHLSAGSFYHATSELYKFYAGLEYRFGRKIALAAGPTFNLYWTDALLPDYKTTYSKAIPFYSYNYDLPNDFNLKAWYGFKLAVRFF